MDAATIAEVEKFALDMQSRWDERFCSLRLVVYGTGLTLLGQADTHHAKQLAQHVVMAEIDLPLLAKRVELIRGNSISTY